MKRIRFEPSVPAEVRAIEREAALQILTALHRYAETGVGSVKSLRGEFEGLLRLRVGNHVCCSMRPRTPSPSTTSSIARTLTAEEYEGKE